MKNTLGNIIKDIKQKCLIVGNLEFKETCIIIDDINTAQMLLNHAHGGKYNVKQMNKSTDTCALPPTDQSYLIVFAVMRYCGRKAKFNEQYFVVEGLYQHLWDAYIAHIKHEAQSCVAIA